MRDMATEDLATAFADAHDPAGCDKPGCMHGKWAEQIEMMRRIDPATVELISAATPLCAGKTFEHHDSLTWDDAVLVRWRCADCGTTGGYAEINERMMPVVPWIDRVRAVMNLYPVILLPSDAKPGFFGDFMGCKVYRVQGIDKPMVALAGA